MFNTLRLNMAFGFGFLVLTAENPPPFDELDGLVMSNIPIGEVSTFAMGLFATISRQVFSN
jgi:hypothetical protein